MNQTKAVKPNTKDQKQNVKQAPNKEAQMTAEEKRDEIIQSADKYDKFDSGNSKIDHLGEIGDMLDEGEDERKENMRAQ